MSKKRKRVFITFIFILFNNALAAQVSNGTLYFDATNCFSPRKESRTELF